MYYVYIIRCTDNSLYTGIASDIKKRLTEHFEKSEKSAKYTKSHTAESLEALWQCRSKSDALKIEYQIKQLTKSEKEKLISENIAPESICIKLLGLEFDRMNIGDFIFKH